MIDRRLLITLLGLLVAQLLGGPMAVAQPIVIDHEYEYKAAYLYHFALLCTWPRDEEDGPIVVGVLGPDRFGRQLQRIERQSGNRIRTQPFPDISDLEACHILFVSGTQGGAQAEQRLAPVLERTGNQATLVFTEVRNPDFTRQGVALNFYIENNRLKLLINLQAAQAAGVTIPERLRNLPSVTIHRHETDD